MEHRLELAQYVCICRSNWSENANRVIEAIGLSQVLFFRSISTYLQLPFLCSLYGNKYGSSPLLITFKTSLLDNAGRFFSLSDSLDIGIETITAFDVVLALDSTARNFANHVRREIRAKNKPD